VQFLSVHLLSFGVSALVFKHLCKTIEAAQCVWMLFP
jgi:sRNA-binding regulator protein Hfq